MDEIEQAIAGAMHKANLSLDNFNPPQYQGLNAAIEELADLFESRRAEFNREQFWNACYPK